MALAAEALLRLRAVFDGQGFDQARKALGGIEKTADNAKASFRNVIDSTAWQGAAVAAAGIGAGLIYSAKKAMELETQMVQVRKVVEFDSPNGLKQLTQDLVTLSTQIPYSAKELGELAAAAGQAGYAEKDIMKFVNAAATMGTAFNMSAKDAGDAMIAFQAAMGLPLDDAIKLGDAINHLSDNMKGVVEPEALVEVTKRIGAIGVASGLSAKEVAALGAAFLAPGTKAEVAATGLKNFLKALTQGEAGSKSFRAAMDKLMGMPNAAQLIANNMQTDPKGTIMKVIEQLRKVPKELQAGLISDIFGEESKAAIQPLLTNTKLLADAFGLVADEGKFAGSMTKEFQNQLNSTDAQLKIFKNNTDALAIGLGAALLPGINAIVKALLPFVQALAAAVEKVPGLSTVIVGLGVAFAGLVISAPFIASLMTLATALKGLSIAASVSGWLGALMPALRGLSAGGAGTGLFSGILAGARALPGLVMGALRGLPGMLRGLGGGIFAKNIRLEPNIPNIRLEKVGNPLPWLGRLGPTLAALGARLLTLGSVVARVFMGPVGWVTLLVTAGVALYAFRDKISAFIANVGPKLANLFAPLKNLALGQPGQGQGQGQPGQPKQQANPIESFLAGLSPALLGARIGQALSQAFAGLGPRLQLLGQQLWNGITTALAGIGERFSTIWTQITTSFNTYVVLPLQTLWNFLVVWVGQTIAAYVIVWWQGVVSGFNTWVVLPLQMAWNALLTWIRNTIAGLGAIWNGIAQGFNTSVILPLQAGWNNFVAWLAGKAGEIKTSFMSWWQDVSTRFYNEAVLPIQNHWNNFIAWLSQKTQPLREWAMNAWNGLSQGFQTNIVIPIQTAWTNVTAFIQQRWQATIKFFTDAWGYASGALSASAQVVRDRVIVPIQNLFEGLANRIRGVFDGLLNWAQNLGNSIVNTVNPVRQKAGFKPLQGFAKGGYVSGPTLAWVGEGRDSEYIIPSGKMAGAAMNYLAGARGASVLSGANNIREFAKGGFVKGKKSKNIAPSTASNRAGSAGGLSGFVSYHDPEYLRRVGLDARTAKSGATIINGKKIYWDEKDAAKKIAELLGMKEGLELKIIGQRSSGGGTSGGKSLSKQAQRRRSGGSIIKAQFVPYKKSIMLPPVFENPFANGFFSMQRSSNPLALFAKGGYITRPTLGLIGEGRDSEYIIPSRRMAASSMAYLAGARGMGVVNPPKFATGGVVGSTANRSANLNNLLDRTNIGGDTVVMAPSEPTINANYQIQTGEVRQEADGTQWVQMAELPRILDQHSKQLLGTLRTAQGRRAIGSR